jgi:hypothetical protein
MRQFNARRRLRVKNILSLKKFKKINKIFIKKIKLKRAQIIALSAARLRLLVSK